MTLSTSTVTLAPGSSRTYTLAPGEAVTVATEPNCYVTVTETPDVISTADQGGQTNVRLSILQYKGEWTYGPYALGGTVAVAVSPSKSTSSVSVTLGSTTAAVVGAARKMSTSSFARQFNGLPVPPVDMTSGAAKTYDVQFAAKRRFFGVRLLFLNLDISAAANYTAVRVGSAPKHLLSYGDEITWWPNLVSVNNATTFAVPVAIDSAKADYVKPSFALTDFVPLQPVARTDTPTGKYLIRARARSAVESQFPYQVGSGYPPDWNAYVGANGPVTGSYLATSDFATSAPTDHVYTLTEGGGAVQPIAALFSYEQPGTPVWAFGDSMFQGVGSSVGASAGNGVLGWPTLVDLQNELIDVINFGLTGQTTEDSVATFESMVSECTDYPAIVAFKTYSPNDGAPTQASTDKSWGFLLHAISVARSLNIRVLLLTSPPVNTWTTAQHQFNEAQNARAVLLGGGNVTVVDMASAVSDPANRRQILPAYNYDGTHFLDAGHQAVANAVVSAI